MFFRKIFHKIKIHNYISVGGPFGIGKSTLVNALSAKLKVKKILEIANKDKFANALLNAMYGQLDSYIPGTTNEWFLWKRYETHQQIAKDGNFCVMDGSIFQTSIVASIVEKNNPNREPFAQITKELVEKVAYKIGIPKLYVILDGDWKLAYQRIIKRGRKSEINNLSKNIDIFQKITQNYTKKLIQECKKYHINYFVIDAKLSINKQLKIILKKLAELNCDFKSKSKAVELPLKYANIIAIGGMVGAGKTTLTVALEETNKWKAVHELIKYDRWQSTFLNEFYKTDKFYIKVMFQTYMAQYRNKKYIESVSEKVLSVQDRTIFEDRIFASFSIIKDSKSWNYYNRIWYNLANTLAYKVGLPKLYVILDMDFKFFKKRIIARGRKSEIEHLDKNLDYFRKLHKGYTQKMVELCNIFHTPYLILGASLPTKQQVKIITKKVLEMNILKN